MSRYKVGLIGVVPVSALVLGVFGTPALAATTHFQQWIAPLECVENHISNGVATTITLTPQQCDDLLHPPKPDQGGSKKPIGKTPHAPDTGVAQAITFLYLIACLILLACIAVFIGDEHLRKKAQSSIMSLRVSSSRIRREKVYKTAAIKKKTRR